MADRRGVAPLHPAPDRVDALPPGRLGSGGAPTPLLLAPTFRSLDDPVWHETAGALLAAATGAGTPEAGAAVLAEARTDPHRHVYGLVVDQTLVAVYATAKRGLATEVTHLAVRQDARRQGHGRACLVDALRRAGKRPLVAETDEAGLGFYRACGFKLVGKRRHPDGAVRYRLGWHAPRPQPAHGPSREADR